MANNNKHTGPNVPALRFPEFSGEWEKVKLGDSCTFFSGGTPPSSRKEYYCGDIPFIRSGELHSDSTALSITKEAFASCSAKMVNNGDLLLALYGATSGDISISRINGAINQAILCIRPKHLNTYFIKSLWESHKKQILETYLQGGQGNLSSEIIKNISFMFPNIEEQNKISELVRKIDKRIETQSKIIEELKTLRSALSESLYYDCDSFQEMSFNDIGECYSGLSGKSSEDFGSGYPFVPYTNIFANDVIDENQFEYVQIREDESQNTVHYGDLLMTLSSETPEEVGIGSVYLGSESHLYLNSFAFGIHITRTDLVYPPYLSWLVSTKSFRKFILPFAQGSTRYNLQKTDFMKAKYRFPTLERQKTIYKLLSSYSSKIANEEKILDLYQFQKQGLLEQMFI